MGLSSKVYGTSVNWTVQSINDHLIKLLSTPLNLQTLIQTQTSLEDVMLTLAMLLECFAGFCDVNTTEVVTNLMLIILGHQNDTPPIEKFAENKLSSIVSVQCVQAVERAASRTSSKPSSLLEVQRILLSNWGSQGIVEQYIGDAVSDAEYYIFETADMPTESAFGYEKAIECAKHVFSQNETILQFMTQVLKKFKDLSFANLTVAVKNLFGMIFFRHKGHLTPPDLMDSSINFANFIVEMQLRGYIDSSHDTLDSAAVLVESFLRFSVELQQRMFGFDHIECLQTRLSASRTILLKFHERNADANALTSTLCSARTTIINYLGADITTSDSYLLNRVTVVSLIVCALKKNVRSAEELLKETRSVEVNTVREFASEFLHGLLSPKAVKEKIFAVTKLLYASQILREIGIECCFTIGLALCEKALNVISTSLHSSYTGNYLPNEAVEDSIVPVGKTLRADEKRLLCRTLRALADWWFRESNADKMSECYVAAKKVIDEFTDAGTETLKEKKEIGVLYLQVSRCMGRPMASLSSENQNFEYGKSYSASKAKILPALAYALCVVDCNDAQKSEKALKQIRRAYNIIEQIKRRTETFDNLWFLDFLECYIDILMANGQFETAATCERLLLSERQAHFGSSHRKLFIPWLQSAELSMRQNHADIDAALNAVENLKRTGLQYENCPLWDARLSLVELEIAQKLHKYDNAARLLDKAKRIIDTFDSSHRLQSVLLRLQNQQPDLNTKVSE